MSKNIIGVLVEKNGDVKEIKINDVHNLYKSCKLKSDNDFSIRHTWTVKLKKTTHVVSLYSKNTGRANMENKYDLPPPIDNDLFYGNMLLIKYDSEEKTKIVDLQLELWEQIYEHLFGGFEDLKETEKEDEEEEDELDKYPDSMKTKEGYLKDGFIVENSDDEEDDDDEDDDDEIDLDDENEDDEDDQDDEEDDENIDECGSELDYEDYVYSDEDE
jgi:hypothetical protein